MDAGGVYETFLAVLQTQQFAVVRSGEAYKIVPEANARQEGGTDISSGAGIAQDELVTHVYPVKNASAVQLVNVLRPLVAQGGQLAAYTPGNIIIISDRASNVLRVEKLMEQIDVRGDRDIELIPLDNATADEVVKSLSALQQADRQADPTAHPPTIIADERSNSVLVAGDPDERARMKDIIKQLDAPTKDDSYIQVVPLKYASAEALAPILQGYSQSSGSRSSSKLLGGSGSGGSMFGSSSSSGGLSGASAGAPPSPTPSSPSGGSSGGSSNIFDRTTIVADKDTNSLVISAPPKTMRMIRNVIAQLDIVRKQVLVDAIIAEISANRASDLGVDWAVYNPHSIAAAGILNNNTLQALQTAGQALGSSTGTPSTSQIAGAASGLIGQGLTGVGGMFNGGATTFGALLKALRSDGDTNILSTPSLTVLDNEEAKISVGQEVPFQTGSYSNTGTSTNGAVNPFQTFDRKDVGLALGMTPTITAGNSITLQIELENSSLSSGTAGTANLITNKRTVSNKVSVEDGQILVLGGLTDDQLSDAQNRIPVLGDIPLIGSLFRSHSVQKVKRNLMIFIHPVILTGPNDGDYYTRLKYGQVRQSELGASTAAVPLVGGQRPLLHEYDDYLKSNNKPVADAPAATTPAPASAPAPATPAASPAATAPAATPSATSTPAPAAASKP
jgi:general secretion pathway protein D